MSDLVESLTQSLGDSYTFERELLGGAMSRVFVAQDKKLGRRVAVKVLSREVAAEVKTERFRLEIQLAARLSHPHIVPLLQSGELNGILYYTMPYIDGESLRRKIDRDGALPIKEGIRILRQVASAIAYAHRNGVVHRDIKPDNVLLSDEFALVADFGVARALSAATEADGDARLTSGGVALGTPAYMAPEQALADPEIDHRADIYAFGILAYEVLTGAPPFKGKSAQATLAAHVVQPPDPIETKREGIPPEVAAIVMACIEKKPGDRPQSASDLVGVFDAAGASTASGPTLATGARPSVAQQDRKSLPRWIIGAAAAVAVIAVTWLAVASSRSRTASADEFNSVAVLPLVNVGGDRKDEYFSDGMTDELANALSKLPGLRVASRTSAYSFKGKSPTIEDIRKILNVKTFLEGTVRRDGNRLRVSAQLTNAADGLALWSNTYESNAQDVFTVQDEIAKSIAEALKLKLGTRAGTFAKESRGTENITAWDHFVRGNFFLNARGASNLRNAIQYFDSAIVRDPNFARAYAASATAWALLPEYTDTGPPDASQRTRAAATKALSIDPTLADAYTALGLAELHDWNFQKADSAYRRALALDPQNRTAHQWYGELLFHTGRLDSAIAQIRAAIAIDQLAPINASAVGYALYAARRYSDAEAELKKGIQLNPQLGLHHFMLGDVYLATDKPAQAVPELETAARLDPEVALRKGLLANAYARTGRMDDARRIISELEQRQKSQGKTGAALASAYLGTQEYDKALSSLEAAVNEHDITLLTSISPIADRLFDPLRSNPRFDRILERMNLMEYEKAFRKR